MAASGNMEIMDHSICSQVLADLRHKAAKYYAPMYSTHELVPMRLCKCKMFRWDNPIYPQGVYRFGQNRQ